MAKGIWVSTTKIKDYTDSIFYSTNKAKKVFIDTINVWQRTEYNVIYEHPTGVLYEYSYDRIFSDYGNVEVVISFMGGQYTHTFTDYGEHYAIGGTPSILINKYEILASHPILQIRVWGSPKYERLPIPPGKFYPYSNTFRMEGNAFTYSTIRVVVSDADVVDMYECYVSHTSSTIHAYITHAAMGVLGEIYYDSSTNITTLNIFNGYMCYEVEIKN